VIKTLRRVFLAAVLIAALPAMAPNRPMLQSVLISLLQGVQQGSCGERLSPSSVTPATSKSPLCRRD
jgi:hypothetical protein